VYYVLNIGAAKEFAMTTITEEQVLEMLRSKITYSYKQSDLAADLGVTTGYVSMLMTGKTKPSAKILKYLGLRRAFYIEPINGRA
jgi:transcriptional regulator with XRE-family HTH domain